MLIGNTEGFARLIRSERHSKGISQSQMAEQLGVSRRWLIEFEQGRVPNPGFATILNALALLDLSLNVQKTPKSPMPPYEW